MSEQKYWNIIKDEEYDAGEGIELDGNFDAGVNAPCHGLSCHEECDCWDSFRLAVREQLEEQKKEMLEVSACCEADVYDDNEFCIECGKKDPDMKFVDGVEWYARRGYIATFDGKGFKLERKTAVIA